MTPNITPEALERATAAVCAQWNMHRPDVQRMLECALPELLAAQPASSAGGQEYRVSAGPATGWSPWFPGTGDEFEADYQVERRAAPVAGEAAQPVMPVDDHAVKVVAEALAASGWATGGDDSEFIEDVRDALNLITSAPAAAVPVDGADMVALEVARRFTPDSEPQRRARLQTAIVTAIAVANADHIPVGYTLVGDDELTSLRARAEIPLRIDMKEVWFWQGDGYDYPESLSCPVIMHADALRALLTGKPAAQGVDWQHIANEWADCACNGVQWIKNVRDFPAMAADALAEMQSNYERIRAMQRQQKESGV
ncbi:hypothetical protein AB8810_13035 [Xanthomonas sp. NCPPB 3005]|uniref:hypothetical protein n=1 Tax=Xanthomonas sp. NCPPB 3005 TaxID=3240913 RepID=UPI003513290C